MIYWKARMDSIARCGEGVRLIVSLKNISNSEKILKIKSLGHEGLDIDKSLIMQE